MLCSHMKLRIKTLLSALAAVCTIAAEAGAATVAAERDTVRVSEFGAVADSYENCAVALRQALQACRERKAAVLLFDRGRYDIWPEGCERREYFISNTTSEVECASKIKTIGMLLEQQQGLTIDGGGARLIFHGKMVTICMERCRDITLRNMTIDFERPTMSECTYIDCDSSGVTVRFHRDSRYDIADGRIELCGEGWRSVHNHCIEYDPESDRMTYSEGWQRLSSSPAEELGDGAVRFRTPEEFVPKIGNTLTVRDIIRDHISIFICLSRNITFSDVAIGYMSGPGIIGQYTRDITMNNVRCLPREGSQRIMASSADFMHFSGCAGRISVTDCRFDGSHDDGINVHGTNLQVAARLDDKRLRLRFMHHQSYGFDAFFAGDSVAFVESATMLRRAFGVVASAERVSEREVDVAFESAIPKFVEPQLFCVENVTWTPEVEIRRCSFTHTPTRGTLVTTPRRVVIADNTYRNTGMSAILIESDTQDWFESGPVCDVLIENNTFVGCGYNGSPRNAVIALNPSNRAVDPRRPVHRNVRIRNNRFVTFGNPLLYAKSTAGLVFEDNTAEVDPRLGDCIRGESVKRRGQSVEPFVTEGCSGVVIRRNDISGYVVPAGLKR